jgi:hypothetical protein
MKSSGFLRQVLLGALLVALFAVVATPVVQAQHGGGSDLITLQEMKAKLRDEGKQRNLSQLTHAELETLQPTPGGTFANLFNSEFVVKIGTSTFIINMVMITFPVLFSLVTVLFFFTPFDFMIGGVMHRAVGALLKATVVFKDFGDHLMKAPDTLRENKFKGHPRKAFAHYMHKSFIKRYKNNITAIAFMGTAFLIGNIGMRGVKFMTAHEPSMIILAIIIEITVLLLLGMTTWYEQEDIDDEEGDAKKAFPGKQLSLEEVRNRLHALEQDLEATVRGEAGMRP